MTFQNKILIQSLEKQAQRGKKKFNIVDNMLES